MSWDRGNRDAEQSKIATKSQGLRSLTGTMGRVQGREGRSSRAQETPSRNQAVPTSEKVMDARGLGYLTSVLIFKDRQLR